MNTIRAFILAAGFGERLRPMTDHIPKPLLPVLGKPVIEKVFERIAAIGVENFGMNLHYKAEMLREWVSASVYAGKTSLFFEEYVLGTGGALKNASGFLGSSFFLVHNADILSDISIEALIKEHCLSGNTATLAVHNYDKFNNLRVDSSGMLKEFCRSGAEDHSRLCKTAFTGISIYSPEFLEFLPEGSSSVVDAWFKAINSGSKIGTLDFTGCYWNDIGTPNAYSSSVSEALAQTGETIYVHSSADCSRAEISGYAVFESNSVCSSDSSIKNCILLPGARIPDGSRQEDAIIGPDYIIRLKKIKTAPPAHFSRKIIESFFRRPPEFLTSSLIGIGGSDRKYFRLLSPEKSAVLMVCSADDPDYERHISYTDFFCSQKLPVPEIFGTDDSMKQAIFEDLGDLSLYSWLKCRRTQVEIEHMYRKVLDVLIKLHTTATEEVAACPLLSSRIFDYDHLRWETGYFSGRFVSELIGFRIQNENKLTDDFHRLAKAVEAIPKAIVHRDFQSQNIMIETNGNPRIIDFQGARMGPAVYDLASMLWDPYFEIQPDMRARLVEYYFEKTGGKFHADMDVFRHDILLCRLQRHMQALGAYGFLTIVKGKKYFLKHIPQAMAYLREETAVGKKEFPSICDLVSRLEIPYGQGK